MTRGAELLRESERVQLRRVVYERVFEVLRARGGDVALARPVASLAANALRKSLRLEAPGRVRRARRVTREAAARGLFRHAPPERVFERCGNVARVLDGYVQTFERAEVADAALVERAVVSEDVGLSGRALSEAEEDGLRQ